MKRIKKLKYKIVELGVCNIIVGYIKQLYYKSLMRKYKFDPWHTSPIEWRKYALDIVDYLKSKLKNGDTVVEIGCGLGEIIRNISTEPNLIQSFGFDINSEVIAAARQLDKKECVRYMVGSFGSVKGLKIDYLITVNFMHGIDASALTNLYQEIINDNEISHILVDTVISKNHSYNHVFEYILPENYRLAYKSNEYTSKGHYTKRHIFVYKKVLY